MMKNILHTGLFLILAIFAVITISCSEFEDNSSVDYTEANKNLAGTWTIIKATRNGQDITSLMDFSGFKLNLNEDGSYSIDHYIPFLVRNDGKWEIDDPQYPFQLIFREGTSEPLVSVLNYPVVNGKRQISLTFTPGCYSNIYTYVFVEESN